MNKLVSLACVVASVSSYPMAWPAPDGPPGPHGGLTFPKPGPDGAYAGDNYFQYINVPAPPPRRPPLPQAGARRRVRGGQLLPVHQRARPAHLRVGLQARQPRPQSRAVPQPEGPYLQSQAEVA